MKNYFRLFLYCKFIKGSEDGCIYNMYNHEMLYIEKKNSEWLDMAENNLPVTKESRVFLDLLFEKGLGQYYESPVFVEPMRCGKDTDAERFILPNAKIKKLSIQLTNNCNLNCIYCGKDDIINKKTGCKKWNNRKAEINLEKWDEILRQLNNLGCEEIDFIGGSPFLEFEAMKKIIQQAKVNGYNLFTVYTNLEILNENIIDYVKENNIYIVTEVNYLTKTTYEAIESSTYNETNIYECLNILIKRKIRCSVKVLISKYNEDEIDEISNRFIGMKIPFHIDFIYCKPDNQHYSLKYVSAMYDRSRDFGLVTKESITFLHEYNNSLFGQIYINLAGDATPHPMMNSVKLGNILKEDIHSIINSSLYSKMVKMSKNRIEGCSRCSLRENCFDFRPIEFAATGKIDGQEFCNRIRRGVVHGVS